MNIVIPTYNRINKQRTLAAIPEVFHNMITLVAYEEEAEALRSMYPTVSIAVCPEGVRGIRKKREYIATKLFPTGLVWVLDDDLSFSKQIDEAPCTSADGKTIMIARWEGIKKTKDKVAMFQEILDYIKFLSIEYPMGGLFVSVAPVPMMYLPMVENQRWHTNTYYNGDILDVHSLDWAGTKYSDGAYYPEDFDVQMQVVSQGHKVACIKKYISSPSTSGAPGGCSDTRNRDNHNAGMEEFRAQWPLFVKLKQDKKDWTRARVDLKKLYKSTQQEAQLGFNL